MSTAKATLVSMLNTIPDDIQDETEIFESLYKLMKLEKSKQSVQESGLLSTDDVRAFFAQKHKKDAMPV
ncbi:MAG: hypothetical protein IJ833_03220 [Lachnospiraceae bacterium]|nr:hypothetical protein [Lachnospiraceae bacterium]